MAFNVQFLVSGQRFLDIEQGKVLKMSKMCELNNDFGTFKNAKSDHAIVDVTAKIRVVNYYAAKVKQAGRFTGF